MERIEEIRLMTTLLTLRIESVEAELESLQRERERYQNQCPHGGLDRVRQVGMCTICRQPFKAPRV